MHRSDILRILMGLAFVLIVILLIKRVITLNDFTMDLADHFCPPLVSSEALKQNLANNSGDLVYDSLSILAKRKDPIAVNRAIELLASKDDYTWLNAAIYLGACGRKEAIPYLIKALRHTAWRSYPEEAAYLRSLTQQDFGENFLSWKLWWEQTNPNSSMDWDSSLGFAPHLDNKSTTH